MTRFAVFLKASSGFTAVEVLVAVAIMGFLYTMFSLSGALRIQGIAERQAVRSTAVHIADDLRLIQQLAVSSGVAWRLAQTAGESRYTFYKGESCATTEVPTKDPWPQSDRDQREIGPGVLVDPFDVVFACTGRVSDPTTMRIVLITSDGSYSRTVVISASIGRVTVE